MADEQSLKNLIKSAIEVNVQCKSFESIDIEEEKFRETLPDEKKIVSIYYLLMIDRCVRIYCSNLRNHQEIYLSTS